LCNCRCDPNPTLLYGNNTSRFNRQFNKKLSRNKGTPVMQSFTQRLEKNDQLWLAVVIEHFNVASATPLRFIGFLHTKLWYWCVFMYAFSQNVTAVCNSVEHATELLQEKWEGWICLWYFVCHNRFQISWFSHFNWLCKFEEHQYQLANHHLITFVISKFLFECTELVVPLFWFHFRSTFVSGTNKCNVYLQCMYVILQCGNTAESPPSSVCS